VNEGYTKLFSSIITSTIWQEDDKTRILWITLLALSDKHGDVAASIPGLARAAGITVGECEASLLKLCSPDPYSRSKEHEGRRIVVVDGGWNILNRTKYREIRDPDKRREQNRDAQQRFRSKPKISQNKPKSADISPDRDRERDKEEKTYSPTPIGVEISTFLLNKILERKPDHKKPSISVWAVHIDRMISIDHRKPDIIRQVIEWSQQDSFWQNNILSTDKLRKQFDRLEMLMRGSSPSIKRPIPKVCFVDHQPATKEITTGRGRQSICESCLQLLKAAPNFKTHKGQTIPKAKLEPSALEDMILKQKANNVPRVVREPTEALAG